jgi:hypothetical protein
MRSIRGTGDMAGVPGINRQLTYVNPQELHDYWPLVLDGLKVVQGNSSDGWIPEDVYTCIRNNTSTLHIGYEGDEYVGFVVLTPTPNFDGMRLNVWCAYSVGQNVVEKFLPEIKKMARNIGAKMVTFGSPRKGWAKRFKELTTIYYEEV